MRRKNDMFRPGQPPAAWTTDTAAQDLRVISAAVRSKSADARQDIPGVTDTQQGLHQLVRIVVPAEQDRRPDELAQVLRRYLTQIGADRRGIDDLGLAAMTLDQLVGCDLRLLAPLTGSGKLLPRPCGA